MDYTLKIELLSATSPGSGEGWAGYIDSDIVLDELGLPFIPAKRIKGILRENAVDVIQALKTSRLADEFGLTSQHIELLFGKRGQQESCPLIINNAYLENYGEICQWLEYARDKVPEWISLEKVAASFTHLRKQTAIGKDGVQKDNSLRVTRVINPGFSWGANFLPYHFISTISIDADQKIDRVAAERLLILAVLVTRYLGSKRNRGIGKIKCSLWDTANQANLTQKQIDELRKKQSSKGQ